MAARRCARCGDWGGSKTRSGLCSQCWMIDHPMVSGASIRLHRESLRLSINEASRIVGCDPKHWIDGVELNELDPTKAAEIICALEAAHHEKATKAEAANERRQPAPPGALAIEAV